MASTPLAREIERRMKALKLNRKSLSKKAGLNETYLRDLFEGKVKSPRLESLEKLALALGCTVNDFTKGAPLPENGDEDWSPESDLPADGAPDSANDRMALIEELDVTASAGPGTTVHDAPVIRKWQLPSEIATVTTDTPVEHIKILRVKGDSMAPTYSPVDRVMVDTADTLPSPAGVFVVWDGLGFVLKRVQVVPHSDPIRVKITSDNPKYDPYERVLGEAYIQGRVIGKWLWT